MHTDATKHLQNADPVLARIIDEAGPCTLRPHDEGTHFHYLLAAILRQQLAGAAARTIHDRVLAIYGGRSPEPQELLATPDRTLRKAGLSGQKVSYLRDLARRTESGDLPLHTLDVLPDQEIITALVRVKGIGPWTAQMFLMFRLGRPDILPELDFGVRKAMQLAYRLRKLPAPRRMHELAASWAPHRTIGSWYMWRSLELPAAREARRPRAKQKPVKKARSKSKPRARTKSRRAAKR
jgi:DNA-3-methyladenine glycosylase II